MTDHHVRFQDMVTFVITLCVAAHEPYEPKDPFSSTHFKRFASIFEDQRLSTLPFLSGDETDEVFLVEKKYRLDFYLRKVFSKPVAYDIETVAYYVNCMIISQL